MEWQEISKYLLGALISLSLWFVKNIVKELSELKKIGIDNRSDISKNSYEIKTIKDTTKENKEKIDEHESRLDEHDKVITTIVTTHNNTTCAKVNKIDL